MMMLLAGCANQVDTTRVAGSDDDQIASHEAMIEEFRSRGGDPNLACEERCRLASQACLAAEDLCSVASRHPDRRDLPRRCARAQEVCAESTDSCKRCQALR